MNDNVEQDEKDDVDSSIDREKQDTQKDALTQKVVEVEVNVDYKDKWMRAQADYQNLQKEVAAQRSEWAQMSERQILEEFIPVYNNFKTAFFHQPESDGNWESWSQGIGYIMKQFGDVLKAHRIEEIKTVGEPFNETRHEAAGEEASDEYASGTVIREVAAGYMMGEKVIMPAKVIIAS